MDPEKKAQRATQMHEAQALEILKSAEKEMDSKNYYGAVQILHKFTRTNSRLFSIPKVYYLLSVCFTRLVEYKQAKEMLRKFLSHEPENEIALYELGILCLQTGDKREAQDIRSTLSRIGSQKAIELSVKVDHF
jgi:Tfp pilus assembly protein PilF